MKSIDTKALKSLLDKGLPKNAILIDVRTPSEYRSEHIEKAINIPLDELSQHKKPLEKYKTIYVQCKSGGRSTQACQQLNALNISGVINVEGGIGSWASEKYPTIKGKGGISIMRQVQIIAGSFVLLGSLLSHYFDPQFIWISAAVGAGLLLAGLTGTCALGTCLTRMPWNK